MKLETTPRSKVKGALRQLWMRSRERNQAIKNAGRCCQVCGKKASQAKGREVVLNAHHIFGINWEKLVDLVFERLIRPPEEYEIVCVECHTKHHEHERSTMASNAQMVLNLRPPPDAADIGD